MNKRELTFNGTERLAVRIMAWAIPCAYQGYKKEVHDILTDKNIKMCVYVCLMSYKHTPAPTPKQSMNTKEKICSPKMDRA